MSRPTMFNSCKDCVHWEKNCSKLIPAFRWKNQDRCRDDAEGKYKKYRYGQGHEDGENKDQDSDTDCRVGRSASQ